MYEGPIQDLIDELGRLPGVGPKGAQRIAFHILQTDKADVERLAHTLREVTEKVRFCEICFNISEAETCRVCRDLRRDRTKICVVEESKDVMAVERTHEFRGLWLTRRSQKSSSPPTRTWRARPQRPSSPAC